VGNFGEWHSNHVWLRDSYGKSMTANRSTLERFKAVAAKLLTAGTAQE
jgi:hypothetical protein